MNATETQSETIAVLLVEDSPSDALLVRDDLEEASDVQFVVVHRTRLDEAISNLQTRQFDAVVLDLNLPDSEGPGTYEKLRESAQHLPIVVLSGWGDERLAAHMVRSGAQDYLMKGRLGERVLARAIRYAIERERVEQALRESEQRSRDAYEALSAVEERMRFALEAARVGIWDLDFSTGVNRWSDILEAQYGLEVGSFGGTFQAFADLIHPDDRATVLTAIREATAAGTEFNVEHRVKWPSGTIRWLRGIGRIHLDEHQQPRRGVGISIDTTEQRTLQAQYLQAQKMDAVGRLAGGVAHDFNNLLTAILGYCELLLIDGDPSRSDKADLEEIQKAATTAAALTRQLLAFSRQQIVEPGPLDLNAVLAEMRRMLERLIGEDIVVTLRLTPTPAGITADRGQVEQVVMNLAVNARDAMPTGGRLTITVAHVTLDEDSAGPLGLVPGDHVLLTVADTGVGMSSAVRERLFEPFFTTKERDRGTGLGLATVHGIVERAGGAVAVRSEEGKGTEFSIYFPRLTDFHGTGHEAHSTVSVGGNETVLVVEDSEGVSELTRRMLTKLGYTVLVAGSAQEAIQTLERHPTIDLVLTDVVMPDLDGPSLAAQLRQRRQQLKVLYMSGYAEDTIARRGLLAAGTVLLHKPFTAADLARKVRAVLDS